MNNDSNINEIINRIKMFESKGELTTAISEAEKGLVEYPRNYKLYEKLGDLYHKAGRQNEAISAYKNALMIHTDNLENPDWIAIGLCREILKINPGETTMHRYLAEFYHKLGHPYDAVIHYWEYIIQNIDNNNFEAVLHTYDIIKNLAPPNAEVLRIISNIYARMGNSQKSAELLEAAQECEKSNTEELNLAEPIIGKKEKTKVCPKCGCVNWWFAIRCVKLDCRQFLFEKTMKDDELPLTALSGEYCGMRYVNIEMKFDNAIELLEEKKFKDAKRLFDEIIVIYHDILDNNKEKTFIIANTKEEFDLRRAEAEFNQIESALAGNSFPSMFSQNFIWLSPIFSEAQFYAGYCEYKLGNVSSAVSMINKAIEMNPTRSIYYVSLGQIYAELGDFDKSDNYYREAMNKDYLKSKELLAMCLRRLSFNCIERGEFDKAEEMFKESLAFMDSEIAFNVLGDLLRLEIFSNKMKPPNGSENKNGDISKNEDIILY